jgi:predicted component of type VI protein secretion system
MAQPKTARITCSECNGWYDSEHELWDHMRMVHRRFTSKQSTFEHVGTKEEWAKLSVRLKNRVQVHFNPEELEAIDRFILLASQGSVFDDVCR